MDIDIIQYLYKKFDTNREKIEEEIRDRKFASYDDFRKYICGKL